MSINNNLMLFGATTPGRKNQSDQSLDHLTVSGKSVLQCTTLTASQKVTAPYANHQRVQCQTAVLGDLTISGTGVVTGDDCDIVCQEAFTVLAGVSLPPVVGIAIDLVANNQDIRLLARGPLSGDITISTQGSGDGDIVSIAEGSIGLVAGGTGSTAGLNNILIEAGAGGAASATGTGEIVISAGGTGTANGTNNVLIEAGNSGFTTTLTGSDSMMLGAAGTIIVDATAAGQNGFKLVRNTMLLVNGDAPGFAFAGALIAAPGSADISNLAGSARVTTAGNLGDRMTVTFAGPVFPTPPIVTVTHIDSVGGGNNIQLISVTTASFVIVCLAAVPTTSIITWQVIGNTTN